MSDISLIGAGLLVGLSALGLWRSIRASRRRRLIDDTPTSKTKGVFVGLVELQGTVQLQAPLRSYLAELECVHYRWTVEEHWKRTVTEKVTNSEGRQETRTRTESGWMTVDSGGETCPFYLEDDFGEVLVQPEGAEIQDAEVFSEECGTSDSLFYQKGPSSLIDHSTRRRRFSESALCVGRPIYVIGHARERADAVAPEIARDKNSPIFLISSRGEHGVRSGMGTALWCWAVFGALSTAGVGVVLDLEERVALETRWPVYAGYGFVFLFAWCVCWTWMAYNSLIGLNERVKQSRSLLDIQLKRRAELIVGLVDVVKAQAAHEQQVQAALAALRTPVVPGGSAAELVQSVAESYPELKSQDAFLALQKELSDTETRIALARGHYAEIVSFFNKRLLVVPDRYVCARLPGVREGVPLSLSADA